jgi:hypothetical protein
MERAAYPALSERTRTCSGRARPARHGAQDGLNSRCTDLVDLVDLVGALANASRARAGAGARPAAVAS